MPQTKKTPSGLPRNMPTFASISLAISTWLLSKFILVFSLPWANEMALIALSRLLTLGSFSLVMLTINLKRKARTFFLNTFIRMALPLLLIFTVFSRFYHFEFQPWW